MAGSLEYQGLYFEGDNDLHAVMYLLHKYKISASDSKVPPQGYIQCKASKTVQNLIKDMEPAIKGSRMNSVGFVLDADAPITVRWDEVRSRLIASGVAPVPDVPPSEGYIGQAERYQTRVGVWLMPDNQQDGKIENFLRLLIAENDLLIGHAQTSTAEARARVVTFKDADLIKAEIHCWLAWQEAPGVPFGLAVDKHFFRHDRPVAQTFVSWVRQLYNIPPTTT